MNASKICILTSKGEISHTIDFGEDLNQPYHTEAKIHPDDSIRTIKMKLLYELHKGPHANKIQLRPSYEELYLYGFTKEETTTLKLFDAIYPLSGEANPPIRRDIITQILEGYPAAKSILNNLPKGETIQYSDFKSILSDKKVELTVKTPLGIVFDGDNREVSFVVDPFSVEKYREEHLRIHHLDDSLLLNYGELVDNTIYVCLADRVYDSSESGTSDEYIARYYYPGLYKAGIQSRTSLIENRERLVKQTQSLLTDERGQYYKSIDLFYEIAADNRIEKIEQGIEKITLRLKNTASTKTNLEMLFKNLHCSREVPYMKFNPGNRRENLYRFYFERTTRTGKKIPYLSRSHIMRMAKETGRGRQISAYLEGTVFSASANAFSHETDAQRPGCFSGESFNSYARPSGSLRNCPVSNCYVHFESDGDIQLQIVFRSPVDERTLDETIRENILPYLSKLGRDVRSTGFVLPTYHGIRDSQNTKVVNMSFMKKMPATKNVTWESVPCIYSICTLNTETPGKPLVARLKRVENFREMDAARILVAELYGQVQYGEMGLQDIIDELVSRGLSDGEESAKTFIAEFLATINEMNGEILERPGFPMEMKVDSDEKTVEIRVSELTSIFYLETVGVYIDAIVQLSQVYKESNPLIKQLKVLCKKSAKFKEKEIVPEVAPRPLNYVGPLRLVNFTREDDFFAQFESDNEDEEPTESGVEGDDNVNLVDMLRQPDIVRPMLLDEDDLEEPVSKSKSNPKSKPVGPMMLDSEDEDENVSSPVAPKPTAPNPVAPNPVAPNPVAPNPVAPNPVAPNPVAPKPTAPNPVAPNPVAPNPVAPKPTAPKPFMFDSESESDSEEETGGAQSPAELLESNLEHDIDSESEKDDADAENRLVPDGLPLKSVLLKRLQKKDPVIFTSTKQNGLYKTFSTSCQPTTRHPVILTQDEFDRTDKSAYEHAIKYGSDPKKQHYFICPRFWCFLTNSAISEEDAKSGKCGKIIPKNAEVVPKGAYVYELNKDDENKYPFPGFIENTREDGKCLPCCFKTWKGKKQLESRERCQAQMKINGEASDDEGKAKNQTKKTKKKPAAKTTQYIISLDTYPTPQQRWGYLPIPVQLFFQLDYRQAIDPNNPAILKPGNEVLLRYGVERNPTQSFLACFADIYANRQELDAVPSIDEFRKILIESINLDVFAKAHNGSLLSAFFVRDKKMTAATRQKYRDTEFALALDLDDPAKKRYFDDAIIAYENFIAFLSDQEAKIDHQYLWDFVCDNYNRIIPGGVNLVVLEIRANDMIDRIELVCPTNLYSRHQYDPAKDTVILLKHDEFYEPIYMYESVETGSPKITRFLSQNKMPGAVDDILKRVEHATRKYCPGMPSLPKIYRFANPVPIQKMLAALVRIDARIETQVVNYQGQTIGLMVLEKGRNDGGIYVPCAPSARLKMPLKYMDSLDIPKDYQTTIEALHSINATSKIPCKPVWKIKENGLIVGVLTETNQFVPVTPNEDIIMDGLQTYEGVDTFAADKTTATNSRGDKERIKMTKFVVLESQFYHAFRNRIRKLFAAFMNRPEVTEIRKVAEDRTILYSKKIERIEKLIAKIIEGQIVFVDIADSVLMELAEVSECDTAEDESPVCIFKENSGISQLVIPKWHLLSKYDNEKMYVGRMADELIRNDRVKSVMYDTETRMNARTTDYQIKPDEFILVQSALTPEYFAEVDSSSRDSNPYAKQINYELANPSITVMYSNEKIPLEEQYNAAADEKPRNRVFPLPNAKNVPKTPEPEPEPEPKETTLDKGPSTSPEQAETTNQECLVKITKIIGNRLKVWNRIFSEDAREYIFRDTASCTFQAIIHIAKSKFDETWSEVDVKNRLANAYLKLFAVAPANMLKVAKIMREQGKSKMFERFSAKSKANISPELFQEIVINDGYFLSDLDIWVLANEYNLPIVVFNANGLKGFFTKSDAASDNTTWIKMGGDKDDKYHFIRSKIRSTKGGNHIYEYNLVVPEIRLQQTGEFEEMVVQATRYDRLNTTPLLEALERFF
jgi:polyhydroxyalkanoate synthesis regulator phasin